MRAVSALKTGQFSAFAVGDKGTVLSFSSANSLGWIPSSGATAALSTFAFAPTDDTHVFNSGGDPPDLFGIHRRVRLSETFRDPQNVC